MNLCFVENYFFLVLKLGGFYRTLRREVLLFSKGYGHDHEKDIKRAFLNGTNGFLS